MRDSACRRCGLWEGATTVCVPGSGPSKSAVLICGEAPGHEEDKGGQPFIGRSGQLLRTELKKAGIENYRITNVVRCHPPGNRVPTPAEVKACRPFLLAEIETVKPTFVLTLGATATKAILKQSKISEAHGQQVKMPGFVGMAAYHPAYCLRDPSKTPIFQADIARFARMVNGDRPKELPKVVHVSLKNMAAMLADLSACEEFAFDTETTSLFPFGPGQRLRCLALATMNCSWVVPLDMPGSYFKDYATQKMVLTAVKSATRGKHAVAFNGKFDQLWLQIYYDMGFDLKFDVMLAHHILDENQPHDLEYVARQELDVPEYKLTLAEKLSDEFPARLWNYCGLDAAYTLRLKQILKKRLYEDRALRRLFYRVIMPAARVMEKVELRGLRLDLPRMSEVEKENTAAIAKTLSELNVMVPPSTSKVRKKNEVINWNSPAQVATILYKRLGLKATVKTDTGADSTGVEALSELKHPLVDKLLEYRGLEKFRSSYLDGWKPLMVGDRLYPSYKLHGTVTGRYSSRIHQVPRDGTIRNLVYAPEGWELLQADYSQAELRIAATLSEDPEMFRCYRDGVDIHWRYLMQCIELGILPDYAEQAITTAQAVGGRSKNMTLASALQILLKVGPDKCKEIWKGWKEGRQIAKSANFGFLFSMQPAGFMSYAKITYGVDVTLKQAESLHRTYFGLYTRLHDWHDRYRRLAYLNGHVRTLTGRMRRLPTIRSSDRFLASEAERQAINAPVQGFIGDLKEMALIQLDRDLDVNDAVIVGEVHDAILFYVRQGPRIDATMQKIRWIMETPELLETFHIKLPVSMEVDLSLGRWGAGRNIPRTPLVYF